jgi:type IV pilus assembly protein PilN
MIKINLLPVRASKKREAGKQWIVLLVLVVAGGLFGNWMWMNETDKKVLEVQARNAKYATELATLNKIIGEVKNIKSEKAEIVKKLNALKKLKDDRRGPVRIMDELATIIPQRVWIASWEETGGSLNFTGSGQTHDEIANFFHKLRESKFFTNVTLKSQRLAVEGRIDFTITCTVNYSA